MSSSRTATSTSTDPGSKRRLAARRRLFERLFRQNEFTIKLGLDAIGDALRAHRRPHLGASRVLVAGTNGKGSVASLLARLATATGARTGLFTSPHLVDFAERIRIDGRCLDDPALLEILARVLAHHGGVDHDLALCREVLDALGADTDDVPLAAGPTLTYFELATLAAVIAFERADCELAVYEVGLGGRLDATNALDPQLSVITTIGLDHCDVLGDTLELIADEKAAIARAGRPAVIGSRVVTDHLFRSVAALGAEPFVIGRDYEVDRRLDGRWQVVSRRGDWRPVALPDDADGWPAWRRDHAATALQAARLLERDGHLAGLDDLELTAVIGGWRWPGRAQLVSPSLIEGFCGRTDVSLLVDGAHNPDGARALAALVAARDSVHVHVLTNCMRDKAAGEMYYAIAPIADLVEVVPISSNRALEPAVYCARVGLDARRHAHDSLDAGLRAALVAAPAGGLVVVTGSLYLVGEVLELLGATPSLSDLEAGAAPQPGNDDP